jgi:hypothetical protein
MLTPWLSLVIFMSVNLKPYHLSQRRKTKHKIFSDSTNIGRSIFISSLCADQLKNELRKKIKQSFANYRAN